MSYEDWLVDEITARIMRTLIENPTISYNKSQLIEAANVSRSAFYKRFEALSECGVIEQADIAAGHEYWTLNSDSEIADALATILYPKGDTDN